MVLQSIAINVLIIVVNVYAAIKKTYPGVFPRRRTYITCGRLSVYDMDRSCVTSYGPFQRGYVCPVSCCPSIPAAETGSSNTQVDGKGYQHVKLILLGSPFFLLSFSKNTQRFQNIAGKLR